MKRAYNSLKNYYVENKFDIIFKVHIGLLVTIVMFLCSNFASVPVIDNTVDALDENDSNNKLELVISQDNSEEEVKSYNENAMLCHKIHFGNIVNDVDSIERYLHKEINDKPLMFVDRNTFVLEYKLILTDLQDFVDSGNLVNTIYYPCWKHIDHYLTYAGNIEEIAYSFISRDQSPIIHRRARAPNFNVVSNALINTA